MYMYRRTLLVLSLYNFNMYACANYQLIVHQGCVRPYICYGRAYVTIETEGAGVDFTVSMDIFYIQFTDD